MRVSNNIVTSNLYNLNGKFYYKPIYSNKRFFSQRISTEIIFSGKENIKKKSKLVYETNKLLKKKTDFWLWINVSVLIAALLILELEKKTFKLIDARLDKEK